MKKVVLVEDDPLLADIYTTKLKEVGFDTVVVDHGEKAVETIEGEKADLVLLDIVLPQVDGWDILSALRAPESAVKDIKVIILSNLGQKEEIEKGLELGADRYLIKAHYTPAEVAQEVQKLIDQ